MVSRFPYVGPWGLLALGPGSGGSGARDRLRAPSLWITREAVISEGPAGSALVDGSHGQSPLLESSGAGHRASITASLCPGTP